MGLKITAERLEISLLVREQEDGLSPLQLKGYGSRIQPPAMHGDGNHQ